MGPLTCGGLRAGGAVGDLLEGKGEGRPQAPQNLTSGASCRPQLSQNLAVGAPGASGADVTLSIITSRGTRIPQFLLTGRRLEGR